MADINAPTTLNGAWLTQNINTNATPGVQLSEARAALVATDEAINEFLATFNNVPDGEDPTIDTEQLAKLLIEASLTQPIHINTPGGLVAVLDGSVIPDIDPLEASSEDTSSRPVVAPEIGEEAEPPAPSDEPAAKGALATIKDVSKAFRKDTPEEIRQKATEGKLTVNEAKMWATTTSKEGRALLGISGRMDAADREILVKQHLSRKAGAKADAPTGEGSQSDTPKKGFFSKAANTVTWPFRKAWEGIKKVWNRITGRKEAPAEPPQKAGPEVAGSVEPGPQPEAAPEPENSPEPAPKIEEKPLEPPAKGETEHTISAGDTYSKIARQNLVDNGVTSPTETLISKRARQILDANPGTDPKKLQIGSKIDLPSYDPAELEKASALDIETDTALRGDDEEKLLIMETLDEAKNISTDIFEKLLQDEGISGEKRAEINKKLEEVQQEIDITDQLIEANDLTNACESASKAIDIAKGMKKDFEDLPSQRTAI